MEEHPPLLTQGFKLITIDQFEEHFLDPFPEKERRIFLLGKLKSVLNIFTQLGISAEVWIDGSFTTQKNDPKDVDLAFILDSTEVDALPGNKQVIFSQLVVNRSKSKTRYNCDIHYFDHRDEERRAYYLNLFGSDRSELNPKGIFKIIIGNPVY